MEPAVIDLRKEHHKPVQKLNVIDNFGWDIIRHAVNRMYPMFAVSRIAGIQRVRVLP
jgi:hypothetical protein